MTVEVKDLMSALSQKTVEFDAAVKSAMENTVIEGENVTIPEAQYKAAKDAQKEMNSLKDMIFMSTEGKSLREKLTDADGDPIAFKTGAPRYVPTEGGLNGRSVSQAFVESDEFKSFVASRQGYMTVPWEVKTYDLAGQYGQKDIYTGWAGANNIDMTVGTRMQVDPIVPFPQRRQRVRDLFPAATTTANLITFIQVSGFTGTDKGRGSAGVVSDYTPGDPGATPPTEGAFTTKPRSNLTMKAEKAPVETIAHWEAAHRNILEDMPQLRDTIDNSLMYGLRLAEDDEILNGSGTDNHLRGILNTPGVQVSTPTAGDKNADTLRRALTLVALANYPANGFVMHPTDWEETELTKATGDGQYVLVSNVAIGAQTQVWRQPVIETPVIAEGTFLTGAFGLGAQLYDRQQSNIRIAEQHDKFFVQNAIAILAEQRLALAVKRPESFVKGTFN